MKMFTHKPYYTSLRRHNRFAPRKCQPWTLPQPIIVETRDKEAKSNKTTFILDSELITEMLKIRRQFYSTLGVGILSGTHATCNNTSPGLDLSTVSRLVPTTAVFMTASWCNGRGRTAVTL